MHGLLWMNHNLNITCQANMLETKYGKKYGEKMGGTGKYNLNGPLSILKSQARGSIISLTRNIATNKSSTTIISLTWETKHYVQIKIA